MRVWKAGAVVAFTAVVVWGLWALNSSVIAEWAIGGRSTTNAGTWGDSFGGFNALFSALAFTAILATLFLQSKALRDQAADLHRQRFESSFFQLLGLMRELRREIKFRHSPEYRKSVMEARPKAFSFARPEFETKIDHEGIAAALTEMRHWMTRDTGKSAQISRAELAEVYLKRVHGGNESRLGPYFRIIYTMLARVREDKILTEEEKIRYSNLLRSQLTSHEVALVAINGLAPVSYDLSDLLTEFRMLKYMPDGLMRRTLQGIYESQAFQGRT